MYLQLLHLNSKLFNLLKLVILDEVNELDSTEQVHHLRAFLLFRLYPDLSEHRSQEVQGDSAVFSSIEAQSYLFRPVKTIKHTHMMNKLLSSKIN